MEIINNFSLRQLNTFAIDVSAEYYTEISNKNELEAVLDSVEFHTKPLLVLGGGSNLLLTADFPGLVAKNNFKGISLIDENADEVIIEAGAGENWDAFVEYCTVRNYWGLENLSLIPGTVGASPIQNIGAYGSEVKDSLFYAVATETSTGKEHRFFNKECNFGYRNSIFKQDLKGKIIITSVAFALKKNPAANVRYGALKQELEKTGLNEYTPQIIRNVVCRIRKSKLPDPCQLGNAGSFFKNPEITASHFTDIKRSFPEAPSFPAGEDKIKIPAGWLIEKSGWKGKRTGSVGVYEKQALILVNYGNATGAEIVTLSEKIRDSVQSMFNIVLETEVNIF